MIGLQVLKNTLQRRAAVKGDSFAVILTGELFGSIITVIHKILQVQPNQIKFVEIVCMFILYHSDGNVYVVLVGRNL